MKLAFLILRKNYYRLLGPVVEEALRRGHTAECWHDWGGPRRGGKSYEFPDAAPAFRAGSPQVHGYGSLDELAARWRLDPPDAVVSIDPPDGELRAGTKAQWLWLQYVGDILFQATPRGIVDADALGLYSEHWRALLEARLPDAGIAPDLDKKAVVVGVPELDEVRAIDPDEVRRRLALPAGQPIVLYLPFPLRSLMPTPWLRHVHTPATRLEQAMRTALSGRWEYWPNVVKGWNDRRIVAGARDFCDRHGALLVMKSRQKDPFPRYAIRRADRAFYDLSHHPPTILELMSVASLCVHFYSAAVMEAAYCGVPSLCLAPRPEQLGPASYGLDFVHNGNDGGLYNAAGVAYWQPLDAAFEGFRRWTLDDFPLVADARRRYVERFLGFDDGCASGRLIDTLERMVARR